MDQDPSAAMSKQLRETIALLYEVELAASGSSASDVSTVESLVPRLTSSFASLETFREGLADHDGEWTVPQDVMEYIEAGRNPNVYTRQFSEAVVRENQHVNGKMSAYNDFARLLSDEIISRIPGLTDNVQRALGNHVVAPKENS